MENRCTVATISNAEVLIDSYSNEQTGDVHLLCLRSNNNNALRPPENDDSDEDDDDDAEPFKYKHWTELIEIKVNLQKL